MLAQLARVSGGDEAVHRRVDGERPALAADAHLREFTKGGLVKGGSAIYVLLLY